MNTFKKGDEVMWCGQRRRVASTMGCLVYFDGGMRGVEYDECTLVPADKFLPGDVVTLAGGKVQYTIKGTVNKGIDRKAYAFTSGSCDWDYEDSIKLIRRPNDGVAELLKAGKKIDAIKLHRTLYGTGLKESKDAVEAMEPATLGDILGSAPAIVIRFDKGKYEPNPDPRIHDSIEDATKEAVRLARLNPGIAFHALAVSTISTATAPTVTTMRA